MLRKKQNVSSGSQPATRAVDACLFYRSENASTGPASISSAAFDASETAPAARRAGSVDVCVATVHGVRLTKSYRSAFEASSPLRCLSPANV